MYEDLGLYRNREKQCEYVESLCDTEPHLIFLELVTELHEASGKVLRLNNFILLAIALTLPLASLTLPTSLVLVVATAFLIVATLLVVLFTIIITIISILVPLVSIILVILVVLLIVLAAVMKLTASNSRQHSANQIILKETFPQGVRQLGKSKEE